MLPIFSLILSEIRGYLTNIEPNLEPNPPVKATVCMVTIRSSSLHQREVIACIHRRQPEESADKLAAELLPAFAAALYTSREKDGFSLSPGKALERKSARFLSVFLKPWVRLWSKGGRIVCISCSIFLGLRIPSIQDKALEQKIRIFANFP